MQSFGAGNQCNALLNEGKTPEYVCKYCLLCVADTVVKMTKAAQKEYPGLPVVCAGGVMSSDIIRAGCSSAFRRCISCPGSIPATTPSACPFLPHRGLDYG